jgi:aspartate-semialdehyde dehydrogenase
MSASPQIAIVGATGAVGAEMLNCLETSAPAGARVALFASPRSAGQSLSFRGAPSSRFLHRPKKYRANTRPSRRRRARW